MPLPDFLRSNDRIGAVELRRLPRLRHGDVLLGTDLLADDELPTDRAEPLGRKFDLTCERQKQDFWCWAAVAASLARFYDDQNRWEQCDLVNRQLMTDRCCGPDAATPVCDRIQRLDKALKVTGNYVSHQPVDGQGAEPPMSFEDVQSQINSGRVVCSRVGWNNGGGHFQMIIGWRIAGGEKFIIIADPIYDETVLLFSSFASRYEGGGKWNVAYVTAPIAAAVIASRASRVHGAMADLVQASATGLSHGNDVMALVTDADLQPDAAELAALFGG